ncbi:2-amino-4-hydroxy-6-hydroxymethyldihydropteridine diphosphokinase [Pedobacter quisquiliarum]|uniref:2-amino-4-hydroxy-6-hydroxymethyldihydropteridine pyrophosphokinase n=1 Tax=Pedobacter quisquiliarum TaxID=1834438 RepID=A0A916U2J7_9SPHI|nr:2-amino-4-hydroxy-6-hydroxymethyldihydropteridine diphosphokinase [Pedobacter quisquiliarum]GGC58253.1 2-amino-4-hydroxy-6-hydroxymethyldihydropteridine diphosphokinase [Pedobacter quisquiliarum]
MVLEYKEVYMLLGSNLGDREMMMQQAVERIEAEIGVISARSAYYETEPWGNTNQPPFINMAIAVRTWMPPLEVLETALNIEKSLGRKRLVRWGSRTIDIDLIFYADDIIAIEDKLYIPHPEMQNRRFVLEPLAEIAADYIHPVLKKSIKELLQSLMDITSVEKI